MQRPFRKFLTFATAALFAVTTLMTAPTHAENIVTGTNNTATNSDGAVIYGSGVTVEDSGNSIYIGNMLPFITAIKGSSWAQVVGNQSMISYAPWATVFGSAVGVTNSDSASAFGRGVTISNSNEALAMGRWSSADTSPGAVSAGARANVQYSSGGIAIGNDPSLGPNSGASVKYSDVSMAVGPGALATSVIQGQALDPTLYRGLISFGARSVTGYGVANAVAFGTEAAVIGDPTQAPAAPIQGGIAGGYGAQVVGNSDYSAQFGSGGTITNAQRATGLGAYTSILPGAHDSVALGSYSVANESGTVSVGNAGMQRRIVNVAAGVNANDAATFGQLGTVSSSVTTLQGSVTTLQGNMSTAQTDITGLRGDLTTTRTDVGTLQSNYTTMRSDVNTTQSDITTLRSDLTTTRTDVGTLQSNYTSMQGNVSTLQTNMTTAQTNITGLRTDLTTTQTDVSNLQTTVSTLQGGASAAVTKGTVTQNGIANTLNSAVGQSTQITDTAGTNPSNFRLNDAVGYGRITGSTAAASSQIMYNTAIDGRITSTGALSNNISIGYNSLINLTANAGGPQASYGNIALYGTIQGTEGTLSNVAIRGTVKGTGSFGVNPNGAISVGSGSIADVGYFDATSVSGVAVGRMSKTYDNAVAYGYGATALFQNSGAFGAGSIADAANQISFGSPTNLRLLSYAADPISGTDVANKRYVDAATSALSTRLTAAESTITTLQSGSGAGVDQVARDAAAAAVVAAATAQSTATTAQTTADNAQATANTAQTTATGAATAAATAQTTANAAVTAAAAAQTTANQALTTAQSGSGSGGSGSGGSGGSGSGGPVQSTGASSIGAGQTFGQASTIAAGQTGTYASINANGAITMTTGTAAAAQASVTLTNGLGNTHGVVVQETQTVISGGAHSTTLTLDDNGAKFSNAATGAAVRVQGVADGVAATDAANVGQMQRSIDAAVSPLDSRLSAAESAIQKLDGRITEVDRRLSGGVAVASAMAQPVSLAPGATAAVTGGAAMFGSTIGVAAQYHKVLIDDEVKGRRLMLSAGGGISSSGGFVIRAGISYSFR